MMWNEEYNAMYKETKCWKRCTVTGEDYSVLVSDSEMVDWIEKGVLIQYAMPHLDTEQREFLITGMTPAEQRALYGEEDA